MSIEIYYFTGSGNSLTAARDLARISAGNLIPMAALLYRDRIFTNAEMLGLVFPVYHATFGESGLPKLVEKFIARLGNLSGKYIFAVCTHNGFPGMVIENLKNQLSERGGVLSAGFTIQLSEPFETKDKLRHAFLHQALKLDCEKDRLLRDKNQAAWQQKLIQIEKIIQQRQSGHLETPGWLEKSLLRPYLALQKGMALSRYQQLANSSEKDFEHLTDQADRSFRVNEHCIGCGVCANLCPVDNINMVNARPQWRQHCENCMACYHWCPQQAITGEIVEYEKRIQAPGVTLTDILAQTKLPRSNAW
jgi:Pyruvate/2-oxoacid:ferredoxin oxidoreductase delta subunit